jgi:transcriptional regulator with XRE-family HTH domain
MKNFIKQLREEKRISIKELAEALGMTYQNARDIDSNKVILSAKHFDKLCSILNCSVGELFGEKKTTKNSIKLKYYENHNDLLNIDSCEYELFDISDKMLKFFNITNTFNIICIRAWENNMQPIINNNDFLLIDTLNKEITHKSIYVLKEKIFNGESFEEKIRIKKILFENPSNPTVIIKSLETIAGDYPPYEVKLKEISNMIIGRVIYCGKIIF